MSSAESISFLGRLHTLLLAAPLGLVALTVTLELVGWDRVAGDGRRLRAWLLCLTALAAALAGASGWSLAGGGEYRGPSAVAHRGLGAALTVALLGLWLGDRLLGARRGATWVRRAAVASVALLAGLCWISGAQVTHGRAWLLADPPAWAGPALRRLDALALDLGGDLGARLESWLPERPLDEHDLLVVPPPEPATTRDEETGLDTGIDPRRLGGAVHLALDGEPGADPDEAAALALLEAHCWRCHGAEKQKADLRLDTPEGLASVVTAGQSASSPLFERISLPADDFDVMPPDGPLAVTEVAVLRDWIDAGAPITTMRTRREREADEAAQTRRALAALASSTGAVVAPLGPGGTLGVDFSLAPAIEDGGALSALTAVAARVVELSLAGQGLPPGLFAFLPQLPALERLHLERTRLGDDELAEVLPRTPALRYLNLHGTRVTAASLPAIAEQLPELRRLVLFGTDISDARVAAFADAHPEMLVTGALGLPDDPFAGGGPRRILAVGEAGGDGRPARIALVRERTTGQYDVLWEHPIEAADGVQWTDRGSVLFQTSFSDLLEIDPRTDEVLWRYDAAVQNRLPEHGIVEVHGFQRLADGVTLLGEGGATRLIEVDAAGEELISVPLRVDNPGRSEEIRGIHKTAASTYLVAHHQDGVVREYTDTGVLVWRYDVPLFGREPAPGTGPEGFGNQVFSVERLDDGHTLLSTGNGKSVLEVDRAGEVVRRVGQEELPDLTLSWITSVQRLPDDHWLFVNRHAVEGQPFLVEVDARGRVVWTFRNDELFPDGVVVARVLDDQRDER